MTKARQAKADKVLDTLVNYSDYGIKTRRQFLELVHKTGGTATETTKPKVRWDRRKYNRMDWDEQKEYDRKCAEMIPEYIIFPPKSVSFYEVTRTEFDYFNNL